MTDVFALCIAILGCNARLISNRGFEDILISRFSHACTDTADKRKDFEFSSVAESDERHGP